MTERTGLGDSDLLSAREVADLLSVDASTVARWRADPAGLPYLRIGRQFRYERREVTAYLERAREGGRSESTLFRSEGR